MSEYRVEAGRYVVVLRDDRASEKLRDGISRGIPNTLEYVLACEARELRAVATSLEAELKRRDEAVQKAIDFIAHLKPERARFVLETALQQNGAGDAG